jgi:lipooligosaccharide transport system permease protein
VSAGAQAAPRKMRRLEPAAIAGVMSRELANFRTYWKGTTFSSLLEPSPTSSSSAPAWSRPR